LTARLMPTQPNAFDRCHCFPFRMTVEP
jgi:hypothetical protein